MVDEKLKARIEALPQMQQRNGIERGPILVCEDSGCPLPRGIAFLALHLDLSLLLDWNNQHIDLLVVAIIYSLQIMQ